jgi:hypothetical protein
MFQSSALAMTPPAQQTDLHPATQCAGKGGRANAPVGYIGIFWCLHKRSTLDHMSPQGKGVHQLDSLKHFGLTLETCECFWTLHKMRAMANISAAAATAGLL